MISTWLRDRPPKPDPLGQAALEHAQDVVITQIDQRVDALIERGMSHDPRLANQVDAAVRRRKLELERDLINRRQRYSQ
jgi:hypothetical protein